jgi:hypothetical protein
MLKDILTGVVPAVPASADHLKQELQWETGQNYRYGTCGPTSVANLRRLLTTAFNLNTPVPTTQDVFDLYKRSGNPNFNPDLSESDPNQQDNGVDMQTMLEALHAGGIGGIKPIAFAKIAPDDTATLEAAIALFGGVLLGLSLDTAQQGQKVWDHVTGATPWGGHAVLAGKYSQNSGADQIDIITWAKDQPVTRGFIQSQEDEAWVVIWPEMLESEFFLQGVDLKALADAYKALTGSELPTAVQPAVVPVPAPPAPAPVAGGGRGLVGLLRRIFG